MAEVQGCWFLLAAAFLVGTVLMQNTPNGSGSANKHNFVRVRTHDASLAQDPRASPLPQSLWLPVCRRNVDIRNKPEHLEELRGCAVVEGNLSVVLMEDYEPKDFKGLSFPELQEVTGYVVFYRVFGLVSLGRLFPNLTIIRGTFLVANEYALVVYEMPNLIELGLSALQLVQRGSVRIEKNSMLCFADTVDWDTIAPEARNYLGRNRGAVECGPCECSSGQCWGYADCRVPSKMKSPENKTCHAQCAVGCRDNTASGCFFCKGPANEKGECTEQCSEPAAKARPSANKGRVMLHGRRCVDSQWCESNAGVVFRGECRNLCPTGFQMKTKTDSRNRTHPFCEACWSACVKTCFGASIRSVAEAHDKLKGCTIVKGSVEIEIPEGEDLEERLEPSLGNIREISGSLIVSRSRSLSSLSFMRSLRVVNGTDNDKKLAAIFINDNDNLQYLFDRPDQGPRGDNGTTFAMKLGPITQVIFIYNPRLCPQEILRFARAANLTDGDVVTQYNGFINPCGTRNLSSNVSVVGPESAVLTWSAWQPADELIGYAVFVTPALRKNITEYAGADLCQQGAGAVPDPGTWAVIDVRFSRGESEVSQIVPRLRPATLYAYYIKTYTTKANVNSPIKYFRTRPDRPWPPASARAAALRSSPGTLLVAWEPPLRPNGALSHYIVTGRLRDDDDERQVGDRDYCEHPASAAGAASHDALTPDAARRWVRGDSAGMMCDCCRVLFDEEQCERLLRGANNVVDACGQRVETLDMCTHVLYTVVSENLRPTGSTIFPKSSGAGGFQDGAGLSLSEEWLPGGTAKRRFVRIESAAATHTHIETLLPYGLYSLKVHACGLKPRDDSEHLSAGPPLVAFCSAAAVTSARTLAIADADLVMEANATLHEDSLNISWSEPRSPNGMVVAYHVRYRDRHRLEGDERCVSRQNYRVQKGQVRIPLRSSATAVDGSHHATHSANLADRFVVQVRAVSLSGPGRWVDVEVRNVSHLSVPSSLSPPSLPPDEENSAPSTNARAKAGVVVAVMLLVLALLLLALFRRRAAQDRQQGEVDGGRRRLVNSDLTDCWDLRDLPNDEDQTTPRRLPSVPASLPAVRGVQFIRGSYDLGSGRVCFTPLPSHLDAPAATPVSSMEDMGQDSHPSTTQQHKSTLRPPPGNRKQDRPLEGPLAALELLEQKQPTTEIEKTRQRCQTVDFTRWHPSNPFHPGNDTHENKQFDRQTERLATNPFMDTTSPQSFPKDSQTSTILGHLSTVLWPWDDEINLIPCSNKDSDSFGCEKDESTIASIVNVSSESESDLDDKHKRFGLPGQEKLSKSCSTDSFISVNLNEPEQNTNNVTK